ncbi:MAG: DMT family transporter [Vulcanimicrobiaceae bacterium]
MPYFILSGAQLAIGAAAIFARLALHGAGALAVSAVRLFVAAVVMLLITRLANIGRRAELAFALAGLILALHFATWIGSLEYTSVAISTLLVCTVPLWTEIYDCAIERRLPPPAYFVSLVLALTGVATMAVEHATPAPIPGHALLGDALALLGSIAMGAYLIIVRNVGAQPADGRPFPTRQIVARTYAWAALALVVMAAAAHQMPPPPGDTSAWFGILAMALVSQLLGHTGLNAALRAFSPSTVGFATLLEPVVAALLAALFLSEPLKLLTVVGGALVLTAVAVTLRYAPSRELSIEP